MKTITNSVHGPFRVETSQPLFLAEPTYHAIIDDEGAEVGRVHVGDDEEMARKLAERFAAAPDLLEALRMMHKAFSDMPLSPSRPDRIDALMTARNILHTLNSI